MKRDTSWEKVSDWYGGLVGEQGHYFHEKVILPHLEGLICLNKESRLLDLACGDGILGRTLARNHTYTGLDLSKNLIKQAQNKDKNKAHTYHFADVTKQLPVEGTFTHATILLALQNIEHPDKVLQNAHQALTPNGQLVLVINHPCFRIPRQSSWAIDEPKKLQYRRIDRYMSDMTIPIRANPSQGKQSVETLSFHRPLSHYCSLLSEAGFVIKTIEEWCSDKVSSGRNAKMENRARDEIPLFMAISCRKNSLNNFASDSNVKKTV